MKKEDIIMKQTYEYSPLALKFFSAILYILSILILIVGVVAVFTASIIIGIIMVLLGYIAFKCAGECRKIAQEKESGTFDIKKYTEEHESFEFDAKSEKIRKEIQEFKDSLNEEPDTDNIIDKFPERDKNGKRLLTIYDTVITGISKGNNGVNPQDYIEELEIGEEVFLIAEPENKYDKYAVKVCNKDGIQLGWIPRGNDVTSEKLQIDISERLQKGCTVLARVLKKYETQQGYIGIVIVVARYAVR